jgi:pSer/pThr/pTyr-binding forkhead associated (FHA) protein
LNAEEASRLSADRAAESILESDQEGLTQLITREFMEAMDGEEVSISRSKKATEPRKIELRIVTGPDQGKTLTFEKSKIVIGRMQADAKIRDVDVSRKHAVLEVQEEGEVLLRDLASTNGTFVNGKRISNCVLSSGDRLQVGATQLIFSLRGHS